jgi:cyclic pyranopterin phosphate synthase
VKVNCVVQRGVNDHTVLGLVERFRGTACVLRFIEYMDVGTMNGWNWDQVVPARELVAMIGEKWPLRALEENYRGEVAQRYAFEDGQGEIGMITSVSQPFCGECNRLRMSPDGQLYMCLFGVQGVDLRTAMRMGDSDAHIKGIIAEAWKARADRYSEERASQTKPRQKVEMYHIGG